MIHIALKSPSEGPERPCVYRMNFGKRFFIWKAKSLPQSLKTISKDLERKIKNPPSSEDLFYEMAAYMRRFRVFQISVEVLLSTDDTAELLDFERKCLLESQGDPGCCNLVFVPHVPSWIVPNENKALQSTKKVQLDKEVGKDVKVSQKSGKAATIENVEVQSNVSSHEIENKGVQGPEIISEPNDASGRGKVQHRPGKPLQIEPEYPESSPEMPDISLDDISSMLRDINAGKK